jgi:hypothetical protein
MQEHLCQFLAHYLVYIGSRLDLPILRNSERIIVDTAHHRWQKQGYFSWLLNNVDDEDNHEYFNNITNNPFREESGDLNETYVSLWTHCDDSIYDTNGLDFTSGFFEDDFRQPLSDEKLLPWSTEIDQLESSPSALDIPSTLWNSLGLDESLTFYDGAPPNLDLISWDIRPAVECSSNDLQFQPRECSVRDPLYKAISCKPLPITNTLPANKDTSQASNQYPTIGRNSFNHKWLQNRQNALLQRKSRLCPLCRMQEPRVCSQFVQDFVVLYLCAIVSTLEAWSN